MTYTVQELCSNATFTEVWWREARSSFGKPKYKTLLEAKKSEPKTCWYTPNKNSISYQSGVILIGIQPGTGRPLRIIEEK